MPQELTMTPSEATKLFEEKVELLRSEMGEAKRSAQDATQQRDKVLHEVTSLQRDKDKLVQELADLKRQQEQFKASMAEHRKNVEASLNAQEAKARVTIDQADKALDDLRLAKQAVTQLRSQVAGIKQTILQEVNALLPEMTKLVKKVSAGLAAIPD